MTDIDKRIADATAEYVRAINEAKRALRAARAEKPTRRRVVVSVRWCVRFACDDECDGVPVDRRFATLADAREYNRRCKRDGGTTRGITRLTRYRWEDVK